MISLIVNFFLLIFFCQMGQGKENIIISNNSVEHENTQRKKENEGIFPDVIWFEINEISPVGKTQRTKEEYLKWLHNIDQEMLKDNSAIVKSIPQTDEEFGVFYSLSYEEGTLELYYLINDAIFDAVERDLKEILLPFYNMAEFVDGEYAEYYFDNILFIIKKNTQSFCQTYLLLTANSKYKLGDFYENYCSTGIK
ncbi:hypothetical protein ACJD0Z_06535 [Flavobacteriaceae bacterium M23B6Z8]